MPENSKQEILLSDLNIIQSQVEILANKCKDLKAENDSLETRLAVVHKEKTDLLEKISKLETELQKKIEKTNSEMFSLLGEKEKEELKNNINDLLTRIDFHLSADASN